MLRAYKKILLCFILFSFSLFWSYAQEITLRGRVIDKNDTTALPFALVKLSNYNDSAFVAGASADENGAFILNIKQKGNPMKIRINLNQMNAHYNDKWDSRFFKIALTYSFGKKTIKDIKKREKSNTEETDRLK